MNTEAVDKILNSILGLRDYSKDFSQEYLYKSHSIELQIIDNNREKLFETVEVLANKIEEIQLIHKNIETKVVEVHAAQLGKLTKPLPKKRSTKKEIEEAELAYIQSLRANAHMKIANGLYEIK